MIVWAIAVLYGCVSVADIPMRAKTTLKMHKTSTFDVGILLNGVCDVNGAPLLVVRK